MIPTLLIVSCLALNDEPVRLQIALHKINRIVADCEQLDDACIESIHESGILDRAYKVSLKVESVTASEDEQATIIRGSVRCKRTDLTECRTSNERRAIRESLLRSRQLKERHARERKDERSRSRRGPSICQRIRTDGPRPPNERRRRRGEKRARDREHLQLVERSNRAAVSRKNQIENVQIRILDQEHKPSDFAGRQYLKCVVRIDSLTLRPGIEEIGSPPAIDKLFARFEEVTLKKRRRLRVATAEK